MPQVEHFAGEGMPAGSCAGHIHSQSCSCAGWLCAATAGTVQCRCGSTSHDSGLLRFEGADKAHRQLQCRVTAAVPGRRKGPPGAAEE